MFKFYNEEKQKNVYRLWVVLLVEFIGTFAMVFWIIAPSSLGWNSPEQTTDFSNQMYNIFFSTYIGLAFYVSTFILILIFLFRNISVNLNPAISLAEVAVGNLKWNKAIPMIAIQFFGAIIASVLVYRLIDIIGTDTAIGLKDSGDFTLNSVAPKFNLPQLIGIFNGIDNWDSSLIEPWTTKPPTNSKEWSLGLPIYALEFAFTFLLISTVVYGQNIKHNARPFIIYSALLVIITFGSMTSNVAVNPARLLAPAMVSHVAGGLNTMQYQFIYLAGELSAVLLVFFIESNKEKAIVEAETTHKVVIAKDSLIQEDSLSKLPLIIKVKKQWLKNGNQDLSKLDKKELISVAKELNIVFDKKDSRTDIEDDITAYLVFGIK